ncbi:phytosulfokine receptor 2-like [Silene latifolia]|uniref:phytosulfokine receptor 2-like n=1 Tax=Silene latifolia TaxID=37657 RepID=UPI003D7785D8
MMLTNNMVKWVIWACLLCSLPCSEPLTQNSDLNDSLALKQFLGNLTNAQIMTTWADTKNCCNWEGVSCRTTANTSRVIKLVLRSKGLQGVLSRSLTQLDRLEVLDLNNNSFSGPINLDFTGLPNLYLLNLASNHFSGDIPSSISTCKKLVTLSIGRNDLTGEIPMSFGNLTSLSFFSSSNNSLVNLSVAFTTFQGCRNLSALILTTNFRGEELPRNLSGFGNLKILALGKSDLHGEIPDWLLKCRMLEVLDLSWNHLTGNLPLWIEQLEYLFYLDLSDNLLSGQIPESLTHLKSLMFTHSASKNSSVDGIPLYVKRNQSDYGLLQYNRLSNFPPSIYLSKNLLSGTIPSDIGRLNQLHVLDLSMNYLTGTIPDSMSEMLNLEVLDLSLNNLHGSIPPSLNKLTFLSMFSVAYNQLQGPIPDGPQFQSFPNSSFEGSPGLCGGVQGIACSLTRNSSLGPSIVSDSRNNFGRISILGLTVSVGISIISTLG